LTVSLIGVAATTFMLISVTSSGQVSVACNICWPGRVQYHRSEALRKPRPPQGNGFRCSHQFDGDVLVHHPSAANNTILALSTSRAGVLRPRDQRRSVCRSSSVRLISRARFSRLGEPAEVLRSKHLHIRYPHGRVFSRFWAKVRQPVATGAQVTRCTLCSDGRAACFTKRAKGAPRKVDIARASRPLFARDLARNMQPAFPQCRRPN
jgi:hypothetical protein